MVQELRYHKRRTIFIINYLLKILKNSLVFERIFASLSETC